MSWFTKKEKCKHEWDPVACTYSDPLKNYEFDEDDGWNTITLADILYAKAVIQNGLTIIEYQCYICGEHYQAKLPGKRIDINERQR